MKDTTILVVTHKEFDSSIVPEGYRVIGVGNKLTPKDMEKNRYLSDKCGDNIASENAYYCELTAQYWGWKNLDSNIKYVGIAHYRRFFFDYKKNSNSFSEDIITEKRIKEILKKYKVIMAFPTIKYPGYGTLYKKLPDCKQDKHWIIIRNIIYNDYPELKKSFDRILYGVFTTWGNMLITTRDIYDEYCSWIFEVLHKYDLELDRIGEERILRVDGFLSEYLLLVWMHHRFQRKEIYYLEVRNTETDSFSEYNKGIKNHIIKSIRSSRTLLVTARYIRMILLFFKRFDKKRLVVCEDKQE